MAAVGSVPSPRHFFREKGEVYAPGLTLGLEESEDVVLTDRALDVPVSAGVLDRGQSCLFSSSFSLFRAVQHTFQDAPTDRTMERDWSSMNSTRTWVTPPRDPVRPSTFVTFASLTLVLVEASC